ncbi:hypothetical protein [Nocardioides litoris]|uniref:hypothetical protein n=1 Tax=Nocardioides litoris TaxID=1926648 RepID=UPI00111EAE58|nr:hypothetical protein [Nocardioides litoris]
MFVPEPWHPARPGVFRPAGIDATGQRGPTRSQSQRKAVRRTSYGFYLPGDIDRTTEQRIVEAAHNRSDPPVVTGWASLHWHGGRWFTGRAPDGSELPVQVVVGTRDFRPRPGVAWSGESIRPDQRSVVDGLLVAHPAAAVSFLMRYAGSEREAVRVVDMAAYDDLVSLEEMQAQLTGQSSWTGVPQARRALAWASEGAWSPPEVDMRLLWGPLSGRAMPEANVPVFDRATGAHVATPDLIDPVLGVCGEYEGAVHLDRATRNHDVRREGLLRAYDLEPVTMVADDRHDQRHFLARLEDGCARARLRRGRPRRWTTDPPSWWVPTTTVAQRRALTPDQRQRFLRYRAG